MSQPYLGEIRLFGGNFAIVNWAKCDGALLSIAQNSALFTLLGTNYGGDGVNTFGLPDLRSRIPVHMGSGYVLAQSGGIETVTLTTTQLPAHSHNFSAGAGGTKASSPANAFIASGGPALFGSNSIATTGSLQGGLAATGGSQAHNNLMPYLAVTFIISLSGIYPSIN